MPGDVDVLVVIAPQAMTDKELFAIDQYLMRGGAVVVAAGNYMLLAAAVSGGLTLQPVEGGIERAAGPLWRRGRRIAGAGPAERAVSHPGAAPGGRHEVVEIQQINYPFFVDVRADGMAQDSPIVANLPAVTMHWASPLTVDEAANQERDVSVLLQSTEESWLRRRPTSSPTRRTIPRTGFPWRVSSRLGRWR